MPKDKVKVDRLAKQLKNCQRQIAHLTSEMASLQAQIDDPDNTNDDELLAELAEAQESLVTQNKKLARLTGSQPPAPDPA